jgi:hypothetical protein
MLWEYLTKQPEGIITLIVLVVAVSAFLWRLYRFLWIVFGPINKNYCPPGFIPHPGDLRNPPRRFIRKGV